MNTITLQQPQKVVFGTGCMGQLADDISKIGLKRVFILTAPPILPLIGGFVETLKSSGAEVFTYENVLAEPSIGDFKQVLAVAREFEAEGVVGVGGGSVLDLAKLIAAFIHSSQPIEETFGIGFVREKGCWLACVPTTAGTGSEVSPNSILLDEAEKLKKGIVSPYLIADAAYIDPKLTATVPPKITAETGMDALSHCIESYTNKFAHPIVDVYALEGIRLIANNLLRAVRNGGDMEAREALALGSYYGGLCLAPVNTAAVHALSYPLGGEYHVSHGLANAILLPPVMKFNMSTNIEKFYNIAVACGVQPCGTKEETAAAGVEFIAKLACECGIPQTLSEIGIPQSAVPSLAQAGMGVTRLLGNNPREVTAADAVEIFNSLY